MRMGKDWRVIALGAAVALGLLAGWAWHDGGIRELRPMSAPAMLPEQPQ